MASTTEKKLCVKCNKGGVATCDGCQKSFCSKHFNEHRQELGVQMDEVGQEHDLLQRDLTRENGTHPLVSRIDKWEQESIVKIQVAAEAARVDLRQSIDRTKSELKTSIGKITEQLQSSRESGDYTEIDLKKWIDQLNELRKRLETPSTIVIADDERARSTIHLIKVQEQQQSFLSTTANLTSQEIVRFSQEPNELIRERFDSVVGDVILSEQGLVATCSRFHRGKSSVVYGTNRYSSGTHHIRVLIAKKGEYRLFFGLMASTQEVTNTCSARSVYGWRDPYYRIVNGEDDNIRARSIHNTIEQSDEITIVLDCNNKQIQFQHHRTNTFDQLPIDLQKSPLPWRFLVVLNSEGDCVRIVA